MSEIIKVENLNFAYPGVDDTPGVAVFTDLDLTIEEGTFVAILGTNGCGKSTLAKHFNSILLPSGGKVYVCGIDTSFEDRILQVRRNVGMVFQNPDNQIVGTIVEEDVAFGPENLGVPNPELRERVDQALKDVGLYEYRHRETTALSGGQKKKLSDISYYTNAYKSENYDTITAKLDYAKEQSNGFFILILLSIGTILLQQFVMMRSQKEQQKYSTVDGQGASQQKMTMIIMTIMFAVFSFMYSSAFSIYMIMSNVLSLFSTLLINKIVDTVEAKKEEKALLKKYDNKRTYKEDDKKSGKKGK